MTIKEQRKHSHPTCAIIIILFSFLFTPTLSFAEIRFWGYTGIAGPDVNRLGEVMSAGIRINLASIHFPEVWTATDLGTIINNFQSAGVKASISLDDVLFIKTYVTSSNCQDAGGPFIWRIRGNWQSRLANFVSQNGSYINPNTTWFIIIFSEVNNACLSVADVQTAASAVKSYFPSVPTVMGYGFEGSYGQPAPASIPSAIDWVGFFNYGYFDPADPSNPYNANSGFLTTFSDLVNKLSSSQRIILVPDGFWAIHLHSHLNSQNGPGTGWPKWYLQYLALNYERFALSQPKVIGMIVFSWPSALPDITGTKDLPQAVRDRHREIGCRNLGGCM